MKVEWPELNPRAPDANHASNHSQSTVNSTTFRSTPLHVAVTHIKHKLQAVTGQWSP